MSNRMERFARRISPAEARIRMGRERGIILLDVRTPQEYIMKHIPGSTLIPLNVLWQAAELKLANKNTPIIVYCSTGNRSAAGVRILERLGYTNIYDLGGIVNWPYGTVSGV